MIVYAVRHAPATEKGICYGRMDVPVAPAPEEAAAIAIASLARRKDGTGPDLSRVPFASIVTSPSSRARTLAEAIAKRLGLSPPRVDARLQELDFGQWEGRRWVDVEREEAFAAWMSDWERVRVPGGESAQDLVSRVEAALVEHEHAPTPLFVTHAGPIRVLRASTQRKTLAEVWAEGVPHLEIEGLVRR